MAPATFPRSLLLRRAEVAVGVAALVRESESLVEVLDPIVEEISDPYLQAIADSAWYRLGSFNVHIRDEGGHAVAAALARSLIEQAAYWDWAIATGVGVGHLDTWAALEYQRLVRLADEIDDRAWLKWLLPPGSSFQMLAGASIPSNPHDAVHRLGFGLDEAVLEPLRFEGLRAAHQILELLAHGSFMGAAILAQQPEMRLPDRMTAIATHLAAAGATAVTLAVADEDMQLGAVHAQFRQVADAACGIHGLPAHSHGAKHRPDRPARASVSPSLRATAEAERMPPAPPKLTQLGIAYVDAAYELASAVATDDAWSTKPETWIAKQSFKLALSNLVVVRAGLEGDLGKALLPFAARMLLEDGARWASLLPDATSASPSETLKALVGDATRRRDRIAQRLRSEGVPQCRIDDLLGVAPAIPRPDSEIAPAPSLDDMLQTGYPNTSGVDSARAMYGVLSQFTHATPISNWHIRRDNFASLTAPTYAIALEATARGFERIACITSVLMGISAETLRAPLDDLRARGTELARLAAIFHLLG